MMIGKRSGSTAGGAGGQAGGPPGRPGEGGAARQLNGASPDKVKNLTKMKAQELKEFLDSSDENTTEITERHEVKTSEPVTFGVSGLKLIDNVTCDLKHGPHGYGNSTSFAITADVSKQWDEKEREIAEAIGKDFIIYRGHIDEGSRGY